jgi:hypothetical protein
VNADKEINDRDRSVENLNIAHAAAGPRDDLSKRRAKAARGSGA